MMLMLNLSIGSSPIATHRTHYLGPFGQRADIALPSHCLTLALPACRWLFYFQAPGTILDMPSC